MYTALMLIGLVVFAGLAVYYGGPWIARQFRMKRIRMAVTRKRMLVLTYDDGPSSNLTPQLLDLLGRHGATATFFMQGRNANRYPEIVDRIAREGHTIGCHSNEHLHPWKSWPGAGVADIDAGYTSLARWIGRDGLFRPPYGKMTFATWWWTRRHNVPVFWWTIDSGDTYKDLPATAHIADAVRREGGGIVLMHDYHRTINRDEFVLDLTSALLKVAESESLQILPLTEIRP